MSEAPVLHATLSISGATCQGCAKKIRNALEPLTGDADLIEVNLEDQTVALPEDVDAAEAARIVTETGYPAEPMAETGKSGSCCSSKSAKADANAAVKRDKETDERVAEDTSEQRHSSENTPGESATPSHEDDQVHLAVTGATCASCVNTIEKALQSVPGVTHAHMNLADNTATATGVSDPQALIKAIESSGYGASVIEDADAADDQKQEEDPAGKDGYQSRLGRWPDGLGHGFWLHDNNRVEPEYLVWFGPADTGGYGRHGWPFFHRRLEGAPAP